MNDLAMRFHFTAGGETEGLKAAIQSIPSTMNPECGILRLRLIPRLCCAVPLVQCLILDSPPPVSSLRFTRHLNQGWPSSRPVPPSVRVRSATASASKKLALYLV